MIGRMKSLIIIRTNSLEEEKSSDGKNNLCTYPFFALMSTLIRGNVKCGELSWVRT
jgi:hypothetical protein